MKWSKDVDTFLKHCSAYEKSMIIDYTQFKSKIINAFHPDIFEEIVNVIISKSKPKFKFKPISIPRNIARINSTTITKLAKTIRRYHPNIDEKIIRRFVDKTKEYPLTNTRLACPKNIDDLHEDEKQCSVCFEIMYRPVQYAPCGHIVCLPCFCNGDTPTITRTIIRNQKTFCTNSTSCMICNTVPLTISTANHIEQFLSDSQRKSTYEKNKEFLTLKKFCTSRMTTCFIEEKKQF